MPWSTWKRLIQKKNSSFFFFLQLMPINIWPLWRSVIGPDTFSGLAPVLLGSSTKEMVMSPSSTVHCGQDETKYVTFKLLMHAAFVVDEIWVFLLEPARKHCENKIPTLIPSILTPKRGRSCFTLQLNSQQVFARSGRLPKHNPNSISKWFDRLKQRAFF